MVADLILAIPREIVAARVRYGFRGRPVVQIQRAQARQRFTGPRPDGVTLEAWGLGPWKDATREDMLDLSAWLALKSERTDGL